MYHIFYSDGDTKKISWVIQTKDSIVKQNRDHADIYKNKVTSLQSKYIALHVGLFWGIGIFIIKNEDIVKIKLDEKIMYDHLTSNSKIEDELVEKRIKWLDEQAQKKGITFYDMVFEVLYKHDVNSKAKEWLSTRN